MRIEDNYRDIVIYNVVFRVGRDRKIARTIILNATEKEVTNNVIEAIVANTFNNVSEVLCVDEVMDGLLLHEGSLYYIKN